MLVCAECQSGENFKQARANGSHVGLKPVLFVTTTKIVNFVSSCSSPVASPALRVVPSGQ